MQEKISWDEIVLPENLDQVILDSVEIGSRQKKAEKWKKVIYPLAGMAAGITIFIGAGFLSPEVANAMGKLPVLGNIFQYLYDLGEHGEGYTQLAESVHPAVVPDISGINNSKKMTDQGDQKDRMEQQDASVWDEDQGVIITVPQYYCDDESIFLSVEVKSSTPFMTQEEMTENGSKEGMIQLFVKSALDFLEQGEDDNPIPVLDVKGVYLDANTFVGIAKGKINQQEEAVIDVPDQFVYTADVTHFKAYCMNLGLVADAKGSWHLQMEAVKDESKKTNYPINIIEDNGYGILNVSATLYELTVSAVPENRTAGQDNGYIPYWVVAFDQDGHLVETVTPEFSQACGEYDNWFFHHPEGLRQLNIYVVDEAKWLDEWKGLFYQENGISEQQLQEVLEENCFVKAQVNLDSNSSSK